MTQEAALARKPKQKDGASRACQDTPQQYHSLIPSFVARKQPPQTSCIISFMASTAGSRFRQHNPKTPSRPPMRPSTPVISKTNYKTNSLDSHRLAGDTTYNMDTFPLLLGPLTRKTKELDHEKLVTVFLGPLSDRHWLYLYMEIVARCTTRRTKATETNLYIFISNGEHVFDCSVEQTDHSVEQRLSLAYRGDLS
jgi:hypothetical protein